MDNFAELRYRYSISDEAIKHDYGRILSDLDKSQTAYLGLEHEIALGKAMLSGLMRSEVLDAELITVAMNLMALIAKLLSEERRERERREKSELAQLKYKLTVQTINSINIQEYQEALTQVRECIEKYVPKNRLQEFSLDFAQISKNKKVVL